MKKIALIYSIVLALLLVAATAFRMAPAEPEGSELYERYKDTPGVRVGLVKDFMVNDSVFVDVTTFEALDSVGWAQMVEALDLGETVELQHGMDSIGRAEGLSEEAIANSFNFFMSPPYHPELHGYEAVKDLGDTADVVVTSVYYRWVAVYHYQSDFECHAVINAHMHRSKAETMLPTTPWDELAAQ